MIHKMDKYNLNQTKQVMDSTKELNGIIIPIEEIMSLIFTEQEIILEIVMFGTVIKETDNHKKATIPAIIEELIIEPIIIEVIATTAIITKKMF